MRTVIAFLLTALMAVPALIAGDLTGKWNGRAEFKNPDGQDQTRPVVLLLKQSGNEVTGEAGYQEDDTLPIEKGQIESNQFTFIVTAPDGGYKVTLKLVSDTRLEGGMAFTSPGGAEVTAKLALDKTAPK